MRHARASYLLTTSRGSVGYRRKPGGHRTRQAAPSWLRMRRTTWLLTWLWAGCAVGLLLVVRSYEVALARPDSHTYFHLFWLGILTALLPALAILIAGRLPRRVRMVGLLAFGAVLTVPSLLLRLSGPYYHDEFPHWRDVEAILETGHLFQPVSIVTISSYFPGLHVVSAALALISGASAWVSGVLVVLLAHLLTLLGVFVLGKRLSGSERAGALAAVVYALNPSFLYFDTQFAYESLAICFFVWVVVLAAGMTERGAWRTALVALLPALACVATHHLSAIAMMTVLGLLSVTRVVAARRGGAKVVATATVALTLGLLLGAVFWVVFVAPETLTYLAPYPRMAVQQFLDIVSSLTGSRSGSGGGGQTRTLFGGTTVPRYEVVMAFAAQLILGLAALAALVHAVRRRAFTATTTALYAFGMLYFASVPLILTSMGAEGARRSWAFSYVGVAVLLAPWVEWLLARPRRRLPARRRLQGLVIAAVMIVLVGNVSAGLNAYYRFPGPLTYGIETRTTSAESLAMAQWLRRTAGPGALVVTDRLTGLAVGSTGAARLAVASAGFPVWELYTSPSTPPAALLEMLRTSGYRYLVIDKRLARIPIRDGAYFNESEPDWPTLPPITAAQLAKFDTSAWSPRVYDSTNYAVYEFDFTALASSQGGAP